MSSQVATAEEGEGDFNFDGWISQNGLTEIKELFIKHNATTLPTLTITSQQFKSLMMDPLLFQKSYMIPVLMDSIQNLQNTKSPEKLVKILISDEEQQVMNNIESNLQMLNQIEQQINELKVIYPKSQSRIAEDKYKQIDNVKLKITKIFNQLSVTINSKKENLLKEVEKIKNNINKNENHGDEKESIIFVESVNSIKESRNYLQQKHKICDKLTSNNAKRKERKNKIIQIGCDVANTFNETQQLLTQNINNINKSIKQSESMIINIDFIVNNNITNNINQIGNIIYKTFQTKSEQKLNVNDDIDEKRCVGLVNLGNTCFMNSIIQCVSNTPHFQTFFTSGQYKPDITFGYLSVPIVGPNTKSLVVDVFHRKCSNPINKPIRHVIHVNKYQKVRDLAQMVASEYETREHFALFYENRNMKVAREYEHTLMLEMVPNKDALACYVLKDWNKIVTPSDIKKKKVSLMLAKLCHSAPPKMLFGMPFSDGSSTLFGMPFVVSFLNIHTRREVHKVIYERLFMWIGSETLSKKPPSFASHNDDDEKLWDEIFESMPYTLRLVQLSIEIPIDEVVFESKIKTKDIDIVIEWNHVETYNKIKLIVNKVVVDKEYSEWKKQKLIQQRTGGKPEALTLDDCINAYVVQETLGENDLWHCSECKKHKKANKKLDLWSFPEILIIHLKRFPVFGIGRFGREEKINTFVDCPIRGLDLTQYVNNNDASTAPIYDLYAVACHSGSCGGGHYTAYALNAKTDQWYYFNDSAVRPAKESDIISSSSYVLFYKKCH